MNNNQAKLGFTLIELLVVVLIIGILASVALPQYKMAVAKSQVMAYVPVAKSLAAAQESYYLANSEDARTIEDLTLPASCKLWRVNGNTIY